MADSVAAERNKRGPRRLWILTGKSAPDDEEPFNMLVFAVCEAQACALAVACAWA